MFSLFLLLFLCLFPFVVVLSNDSVSVLILKLPRSGSSWFTSLLGQQENCWIVPQLVTPNRILNEKELLKSIEKGKREGGKSIVVFYL